VPEPRPAALLQTALAELRRAGAEAGEVYLHDIRSSSVTVAAGKVEASERRHDLGVALRAFRRGRVGFASTSGTRGADVRRAAERAVELARLLPPDPAHALPRGGARPEVAGNFDPGLERQPAARKAAIAAEVEAAARRKAGALRTRESRYADLWGTVWIANSAGLEDWYRMSRAMCWIEVMVPDAGGGLQTGFASGYAIGPRGLEPAKVGQEAAERALAKLGARQPPTARTAVVLDPQASAGLFGAIVPALHADNVLKRKSLFADRAGGKVASPQVTLVDDGRLPGGYSSAPFDGEGVSTRETVLIEKGILRSFLHSTYTARRMGAEPTGNAVRDSYTDPADIDSTNLYLKPSGGARADLLGSVQQGVYVSELMGLHTIDPISGDFSLGAAGAEIRGGSLGAPLEKMAVAGNVLDLLAAVRGVADDLRFFPGGQGGSTVLLEGFAVSGQ
jgi:PmbA protein